MESKYNITSKTINEVFDEIFKNSKPKEREFTLTAVCKTRGLVKMSSKDNFLSVCENPECPTCNSIKRAFKQEVNGGV
tara:strand:- start:8249 stop:8482 length:234 start_codon:yes stop_codon:yes gene_type:complete